MVNVVFVCLGNICRSPTAELVFREMVEKRGLRSSFCISSSGTSDEETGNPIYPPAKKTLEAHGICGEHIASQLTLRDVINCDYVIVMDSGNLFDVLRLTNGKYGEKIFKLASFTPAPHDIADPWITRDFEKAYAEISEGCGYFLEYLLKEKAEAFGYDKRH